MLDAVLRHLDQDANAAIGRLKTFVSIPSVSTDPAYAPDVARAAGWIGDRLSTIGLDTVVHPTEGHPIVVARGGDAEERTHLIFYGHYDVQPPDPLDQWTSDPFEPVIEAGSLRGRGASDDKGQVSCFVEALAAWMQVHGCLPVRVTVILEGEEESGSVQLPRFIEQHADALRHSDDDAVVVISDTTMWPGSAGDRVAITCGLRGNLYYDVQLHGANRDLHSGVFGGTVPNPATLLTAVLGNLFDADRRVTVPGFYDDVATVNAEEHRRWQTLDFEENIFLGSVGIEEPVGEAGFDTLSRRWVRPSCDICGLYGGYVGEGAKTVIPSFAGAKIGFRLAPNQDPRRIADAFETWLHHFDVRGCRWKITHLGHAEPVVMPLESPFIAAATRAVRRVADHDPVLVREGATIPILADFKKSLGLDSLLLGFGREDDRIHAPNEKFDLSCFRTGCRTHAALLAEVVVH